MSEEEEELPFQISLTRDLFTWVDQQDKDLAGVGWTAKKSGRRGLPHYYAAKTYRIQGVKIENMLHTMVWERMMDTKLPRNFLVDHINGDKLDNRRSNLRMATRNENETNKPKRRQHTKRDGTTANSSKYKGVSKMKGRKKCWRAIISTNANNAGKTKQVALGCYFTEKEAAEVYNKAALDMYGEFAWLNTFEEENDDQS